MDRNGSYVSGLNLTVKLIHDSGHVAKEFKAVSRGNGEYRVYLSFDPSWPAGRYKIVIEGPYRLVADKSDFYLNWLGVYIRPHERVVKPGSVLTLYVKSVTLNSVTLSDVPIRPVIATYKVYLNGSLIDYAVGTALNDWVILQIKMPEVPGFYTLAIEASYNEPIVNRYWRGNANTWVYLIT
ncbi:MAG: hypothetical protein QW677_09360 [Pyrobaculum sp.]|uniref:hypothetical protein n=1 Tax=Pyrobaculum sp. TaxID=2004705 RepID=UPI0031669CEC